MTDKPKIIKRKPAKQHPLYYAFRNATSVAVDLARQIAKDGEQNMTPDVKRFIEVFGQKAA